MKVDSYDVAREFYFRSFLTAERVDLAAATEMTLEDVENSLKNDPSIVFGALEDDFEDFRKSCSKAEWYRFLSEAYLHASEN